MNGDGTNVNPYSIEVPIYYGNDLSIEMQTAIKDSAYQMNHLDTVYVYGKFYKLDIELDRELTTKDAVLVGGSRGNGFAGLIKQASLPGVTLRESVTATASIDENKIKVGGYHLDTVITHEIEHLLGYKNNDLGGTIDHTHSLGTDTNMHETASTNDPGMTLNDLNMIVRARLGT